MLCAAVPLGLDVARTSDEFRSECVCVCLSSRRLCGCFWRAALFLGGSLDN